MGGLARHLLAVSPGPMPVSTRSRCRGSRFVESATHLIGLLMLAAGALAVTTAAWHVSDIQWSLTRNLVLFTGLMLLGARLIGPGLGWLLPMGYGFLAFLATLLAAGQPNHQLQWG